MKRTDELDKLFGDERLEPRATFVHQLAKQSGQPDRAPKRARFGRRLALGSGVLAVALVLVAVPLLRPASPSAPLVRTILLKKLYATAMADELPQQPDTTFWDVTQTDNGGPAMASCNSNVQYYREHDLFFRKDNVTAAWISATNGATDMEYSADADVPAFNTNALTTAQNGQISWALNHGTLTDVNGKPLPGDAATAIKAAGTYELYATYPTLVKGTDSPLASCPMRLMDIKIDAATGMFTEVDEYNGAISPDKLVDTIQQSIKTAAGDFVAVEPRFVAVGFNLQQATANAEQNVSEVANKAGGYEFWYRKAFFGAANLSEEKNVDGTTGVYAYQFAKQPNVKYRFYTAKAENQAPKDLADLKGVAAVHSWQVLDDETQQNILYPGYAGANTELYEVSDGTTEYIMFATGTPDIPYVYIEAPLGTGKQNITDPLGRTLTQDDIEMLSNVMLFVPGTTPPASQG